MQRSLLILLLLLASVRMLGAQEVCPQGRIASISVRNHSIFPPSSLPQQSRLLWAYRLANFVHIPTRADFIEKELLFAPGDCFDPELVSATARALREFRFLAAAAITDETLPDGGRSVLIETRDEWTTKVALYARVEDGIRFDGASLYEENLLGRGILVGVFRIDRDEMQDAGVALEIPAIGSTGLDAAIVASRTLSGNAFQQMLIRPFQAERQDIAFRQRIDWREDPFSYVLLPDRDFSHLVTPVRTVRGELTWGRRFGEPGNLHLIGGGASFERVEVGGLDQVEGIRRNNFSGLIETSDATLAEPILPQIEGRRAARLNLLLGTRRLTFETRRGLDALNGVQDIPVGEEVILTLGRSIGSTGKGRPGDLFARTGFLIGHSRQSSVLQFRLMLEGRREDGRADEGIGGWRDLLAESHVLLYLTPTFPFRQTILFSGSYQAGWYTSAPFQLTLGGPTGVRGYLDTAFPGGRRSVLSLESRIPTPSLFPDLMDMGVTLFGDLGSIHAGDAPFGTDSGWRGTLGGGIRVGFPSGSSSVIRADLAFPIGDQASSRRPVFRISAVELLGISGGRSASQVNRSRRSGVGSQFVGVARDRIGWWP